MQNLNELSTNDKINLLLEKSKNILMEIQKSVGVGIISIIYNPHKEGIKTPFLPAEKDDAWYLRAAIENSGLQKAKIILHGPGGDFKVGIKMAFSLRQGLNNYTVMVPSICSSALCFSILKSDLLEVTEETIITQIDPFFKEGEQLLRAIEAQYSRDEERRQKAKRILSYCKEHIMELLKNKPSLYNHRKEEWEDFYDAECIADRFMWKSEHMEKISLKEMRDLNLKVKLITNEQLIQNLKKYKEICQEILMWEDRRVIIGCSKRYKFETGPEGHFLRLK